LSCVTRKYSDNKQEGSQVVNTAWSLLALMAGECTDRAAVERYVLLLWSALAVACHLRCCSSSAVARTGVSGS